MKQTITVSLLVLTLAANCFAGPLNSNQVAPSANWVVHFDADAARSTHLGQRVLADLANTEVSGTFAEFQAKFNFDLRKDLSSLTLFGKDKNPDNGVAVFRGRFDTGRLVTLVQGNATHQQETYRSHVIHSWVNEKKSVNRLESGCVYPDGTVLMGGKTMIREALDTLDGPLTGQAAKCLDGLPANAFFLAAADFTAAGACLESATLKNATSGRVALREEADTVIGSLELVGANEEVARTLETAGKGIIAMALLGNERKPELAKFARNATVTTTGTTVTMTLQETVDNMVELMKRKWERMPSR